MVGTQKFFKNVISLEAFIGPAYSNASLTIKKAPTYHKDTI